MNSINIGILGGMGPRATVVFEDRLISSFKGSDQLLPRIISVNNSQIPDRSDFVRGLTNDPIDELVYSANILKSANVDVVCMPCNTAHNSKIMARLMAIAPLPIIDMPAACLIQAESKNIQKLLILGTVGTVQSKIFDSRSVDIECVYPSVHDQKLVTNIIYGIKNGDQISKNQTEGLKKIIKASDTDAVVLACTELSLVPKRHLGGLTVIDSMDVLVKQCITICKDLSSKRKIA